MLSGVIALYCKKMYYIKYASTRVYGMMLAFDRRPVLLCVGSASKQAKARVGLIVMVYSRA